MKKGILFIIIFYIAAGSLFCDGLKVELDAKLGDVLKYRGWPAVYRFITDDIIFASGADEEPVLYSISKREIISRVLVKIYKPQFTKLRTTRIKYNEFQGKRILYFIFGGNNFYKLDGIILTKINNRDSYYNYYNNVKNDWSFKEKDIGDKYFIENSTANYAIKVNDLKNEYNIRFGEETLYNHISGEEDLSRVRIYKGNTLIMGLENVVPDFYHSIWYGYQYDVSPNKEYVLVLGWKGIQWSRGKNRNPYQDVYLFKITYPKESDTSKKNVE